MPKYYNESRNKSTQKYLSANCEEIRVRVRKGEKQKLVDAAKAAGYPGYTRYVIDAINEKAGFELLRVPTGAVPGGSANDAV